MYVGVPNTVILYFIYTEYVLKQSTTPGVKVLGEMSLETLLPSILEAFTAFLTVHGLDILSIIG